MKKNGGTRLYLWVAALLTLPLLYFLIDRIDFVWSSKTVMSTVENVRGENDTCGGKRKYRCTRYYAMLQYDVDDATYRIEVGAGRERGYDQPLELANHRVGQAVQVAYDPSKPARAYRDTFWDIWGAPLITFFLQICAFFGNKKEERSGD